MRPGDATPAPEPSSTSDSSAVACPAPAAEAGFLYFLGRALFRLVYPTYFRWRVFHRERVPRHGPLILASNHQSVLDPPLIGSGVVRPLNFLARDTLFRFPVFGAVLRAVNAVPVDRDGRGAAGLRNILEKLAAGRAVLMFPEGTRTSDGQLQPARSGIGLVVIKSGAPVVPVRVFGTFEAYGRDGRWPRPCRLQVKYGELLTFDALRAEARSCSKPRLREIYQQIADETMAAIARLEPVEDVAQAITGPAEPRAEVKPDH